jgi:hypothetical protein
MGPRVSMIRPRAAFADALRAVFAGDLNDADVGRARGGLLDRFCAKAS